MNNNKSLHRHLLAIALGVLTLTGCSTTTTTTTPEASPVATSPEATAPNNPIQKATQIAAGQYAGLAKVVTDTTMAATAGDFAKAKTEFAKFEGEWQKVEDAIKVKSPASYEAIENSLDKVNTALQGTQPVKDQVLTSLQTLTQTIGALGK